MNAAQLSLTRNGVFATVVMNGCGKSRTEDRAAVCAALRAYGLKGSDLVHVGGWCMAQLGYGGGL